MQDGMTYSQHNYLNQIGIAYDASVKSNQNKGLSYIKTPVFLAKDLIEPQQIERAQPSDVPPFCTYGKQSYNVKASSDLE